MEPICNLELHMASPWIMVGLDVLQEPTSESWLSWCMDEESNMKTTIDSNWLGICWVGILHIKLCDFGCECNKFSIEYGHNFSFAKPWYYFIIG